MPGWVGAVVVAAVVIIAVIAGNRAINPPLPPPHVTIMSNSYHPMAPTGAEYNNPAPRQ